MGLSFSISSNYTSVIISFKAQEDSQQKWPFPSQSQEGMVHGYPFVLQGKSMSVGKRICSQRTDAFHSTKIKSLAQSAKIMKQ